jgi:hypothetical protein
MAGTHTRTNARVVKSELDRYTLEMEEARAQSEISDTEHSAEAKTAAEKELAWLKSEATNLRSRLAIIQGRSTSRSANASGPMASYPVLKTIAVFALTMIVSTLLQHSRSGGRR